MMNTKCKKSSYRSCPLSKMLQNMNINRFKRNKPNKQHKQFKGPCTNSIDKRP